MTRIHAVRGDDGYAVVQLAQQKLRQRIRMFSHDLKLECALAALQNGVADA